MHINSYIPLIRSAIRPIPDSATSLRPIDQILLKYSRQSVWCNTTIPAIPTDFSARQGGHLILTYWTTLAIHRAGRPLAEPHFTALLSHQQPSGALLLPTASDNPEILWYHELILLHSLTTYALLTQSPPLLDAARRAAIYHLNQTQPDHATTQPWAINAFLLSPETHPLVDQMLHTLKTQPSTDAISSILLADTLAAFNGE